MPSAETTYYYQLHCHHMHEHLQRDLLAIQRCRLLARLLRFLPQLSLQSPKNEDVTLHVQSAQTRNCRSVKLE